MKNLSALLTVAMMVVAMGWYLPLVVRRRLSPAPATWIIGVLAMNIAMGAYHSIPGRTVIENITLYVAAFQIMVVASVVLVSLHRRGELRVSFDWLQKLCLLVMVGALAYWAFHQDRGHVTFWTTQIMLVIAYAATAIRAIQRKRAFDSIGNWACICVGSVFGLIPAVMATSPYGLANSARAIIASGITVGILCYFDKKTGWQRWHDELATLRDVYGNFFRALTSPENLF